MKYDLTISSLQEKGYKITELRKKVVKIFSKVSVPLTADELEVKLKKEGTKVDKSTIYRELQFLLKKGYIVEVYIYQKKISYESSELKHHHHLVCENCGDVTNVTNCLVSGLEIDIYKKKGFKVKRHTLEFYGTCVDCIKAK